jgi:hypothetical protein
MICTLATHTVPFLSSLSLPFLSLSHLRIGSAEEQPTDEKHRSIQSSNIIELEQYRREREKQNNRAR